MIEDIKMKKINMIITKDMSRLGRDYIGVGELIEKIFPLYNVRYISVNDNIDTFIDSSFNDIAPFKSLLNDMYAKDISNKIKSSLKAKEKEGKYVSPRPPFGYKRDLNNKNKIVIENDKAYVVRKIFNYYLSGLSFSKIADKLTKENIKTPSQYYNFVWKDNVNYGIWNSKSIRDILTNQMYVGDLIQNKTSKINYKLSKIRKNNPSEYIIKKNNHEAIIDRETFLIVQNMLSRKKERIDRKEYHLLASYLYCYECNNKLLINSRRKDNKCYTICSGYRKNKNSCKMHCNNYDVIENLIMLGIRNNVLAKLNKDYIFNKIFQDITSNFNKNKTKKKNYLEGKIKLIDNNLCTLYIDKIRNNITQKEYENIKKTLDNEKKVILEEIFQVKKLKNLDLKKIIIKYIDDLIVDKYILECLVKKISISTSKNIYIYFNFKI